MRTAVLMSCLAIVASACATAPAPTTPARVPLRGADCLDPGSARSWHEVSSTELLVDAGRRKYRLAVTPHCLGIGVGPEIVFAGDPVGGRVCGAFGDAIVTRRGERCRIDRIELIDADTWNALRDGGEASGTRSR